MIGKLFSNIGNNAIIEKLLPIFIFDILKNEFHVGGWLSAFSIVAIITTYLLGKHLKFKYYKTSMVFGGSLFALSILSLVGLPAISTYIFFGIAKELFLPLLKIPESVYSSNVIHNLTDYIHHRVEYIVIREWIYVFSSRIIGYTALLFVADLNSIGMQVVLFIAALTLVIEPLILRTIKLDMTKL